MTINFETDNLVIVCYYFNAGGKFLVNCLGLSDDAVLQDSKLSEQQLHGTLSQHNKYQYIKEKITDVEYHWSDLNLGCTQLFGISNHQYAFHSASAIKNCGLFNKVVENLSHSNKKFFIVAHTACLLDKMLEVWPNAKIIYFNNMW